MPTVPSPRFAENEPMHTPFTNLTFCIRTFGCQMNKHDSERIAGMLEGMGALQVDAIEDADVVAFMTCCVREAADTRLYGQVASLKNVPLRAGTPLSKRIVAVGGCIGQRDGEKLVDELKHLDVVFGTHNLGSLPRLLEAALEEGGHQVEVLDAASSFPTELPTAREHEWAAWLPITIGCNNFCSYCIVPYVRGREKSRPLEDIVAEAERYVAAGVKEITLLGQNVNSYGRDLYGSPRFAQVLDALDQTGIERLRFATSHPKDLNDEVVGRFATLRSLMPALHLPVQSGSDAVLAAMNRRYTRDHYRALVAKLRDAVPDIALSTDIIVGFPGETAKDFEDTYRLVDEVGYHQVFTFIYSKREGTPAASMDRRHTARGDPAAFRPPGGPRATARVRGEPARSGKHGRRAGGRRVEARRAPAGRQESEEPDRPRASAGRRARGGPCGQHRARARGRGEDVVSRRRDRGRARCCGRALIRRAGEHRIR